MTARAIGRELSLTFVVENRFGHDRAGRLTGAEEQSLVTVRYAYSFVPVTAGVQQPGSQHAAAGFLARTKALKNLSFT
jgi:hypothetical protein